VAVAHLTGAPIVHGASPLEYVADGDVVSLTPSAASAFSTDARRRTTPMSRRNAGNSLWPDVQSTAEDIDDSYRIGNILRLLELVDADCHELTISGG